MDLDQGGLSRMSHGLSWLVAQILAGLVDCLYFLVSDFHKITPPKSVRSLALLV